MHSKSNRNSSMMGRMLHCGLPEVLSKSWQANIVTVEECVQRVVDVPNTGSEARASEQA